MIDTLDTLDSEIFLFFNGMHCGFFDSFMSIATGRFIWIPLYAALLFLLWRLEGWRKALLWALAICVTITLADQICATLIRPAVERFRPANLLNPLSEQVHIVDGYRGGRYGFPSCHGANTFALVTIMSLIVKRRAFTWFITGWALLNCYSRLYLGVHYPGDLLCGALIGALCGLAVYAAASRMMAGMKPEYTHGDGPVTIAGKAVSPFTVTYATGTVLTLGIAVAALI